MKRITALAVVLLCILGFCIIYLVLSLEGEYRQQMVVMPDFITAEDQFVIFKQIVAVLIYVHLQGCVCRVDGQGIVIGKCDDVVAEVAVGLQHLSRPVFTFVKRTFHLGMCVKISPFPAVGSVKAAVRIVYIRTFERRRLLETINRTVTCCGYCQKGNETDTGCSLA